MHRHGAHHAPTCPDLPGLLYRRSSPDLCRYPIHASLALVVLDPPWLGVTHAAPDNTSHTWRTLCCWCDRLSIGGGTVLLNFGICHSLLLFDRLTPQPVLHPLPLQLHLMIIEDAIERIGSFFRLLTAFPVQLARVVHPLTGSHRPPLHVLKPFLQRFSLFCLIASWRRRFWHSHD